MLEAWRGCPWDAHTLLLSRASKGKQESSRVHCGCIGDFSCFVSGDQKLSCPGLANARLSGVLGDGVNVAGSLWSCRCQPTRTRPVSNSLRSLWLGYAKTSVLIEAVFSASCWCNNASKGTVACVLLLLICICAQVLSLMREASLLLPLGARWVGRVCV